VGQPFSCRKGAFSSSEKAARSGKKKHGTAAGHLFHIRRNLRKKMEGKERGYPCGLPVGRS
jgi:hypothetical protein